MANGHPTPKADPEYWRKRIAELDKKQCKTSAELNSVIQELLVAHGNLIKASCIQLILEEYAAMVEGMPADTGRARAGWQISPMQTEWKPPVLKRRAKRDADGKVIKDKKGKTVYEKGILPEFAALIAKNMPDEVATLRLSEADIIYITNNVEYLLALEAGWSVQAPNGFIAKFLNRVKVGLSRLAAKL